MDGDIAGHRPGTIFKVTARDFITFKYAELKPSQNLNLLIGPNGSGKSSIIAAIIIGLGGNPKNVGRGSKLSDYIRHGCSEATVEVSLFGENHSVINRVRRVFDANNKSSWVLNDVPVSYNDVKRQVIDKFGIKINNLCQFLPQDRIQDFAKMNQKELLTNTLNAVGRTDLEEKLNELKDLHQAVKQIKSEITQQNVKLNQVQKDNEKLEVVVNTINRRKELIEQVANINRKIAWLQFEKIAEELDTIKKELTDAKSIHGKYLKDVKPLEEKIADIKKRINNFQRSIAQANAQISTLHDQYRNAIESLEQCENNIRREKSELNNQIEAVNRKQHEINTIRTKIEKLRNDKEEMLAKYGTDNDIKNLVANIDININKVRSVLYELEGRAINIRRDITGFDNEIRGLESKLRFSDNVRQQRLDLLRQKDEHAYQGVLWLRNHRKEFKGNVYEPMILELNVNDPSHAKYFENCISFNDLVAFTCEYSEDMVHLMRCLRDRQRLVVNVLHSGAEHPGVETYQPPVSINALKKYGFFSYMNTLVTAPEAIMKYLCRMYQIHCIPIGNNETYKLSSKVPANIKLFFSENHRFAVNISRYTGDKSTRIVEIKKRGLLSLNVDLTQQEELRTKLQNLQDTKEQQEEIKRQLESKTTQLESQIDELNVKKKEYKTMQTQLNAISSRISLTEKNLTEILSSNINIDDIKQEFQLRIKGHCIKYMKNLSKAVDLASKCKEAHASKNEILESVDKVKEEQTSIENDLVDKRTRVQQAQELVEKIDASYKNKYREKATCLTVAKRMSDGFTPDDKGFDKFRETYDALPNELEQLEDQLGLAENQMACLSDVDNDVLRAYQEGEDAIKSMNKDISKKSRSLELMQQELTEAHAEWIDPLKKVVSNINSSFSKSFDEMNCKGVVEICHEEDVHEYTKYGISIKVSFRENQEIQQLNAHTQSGGERAITTAIYLLSLQTMIKVPFRCVDEINQGMDNENEKRLYDLLFKLNESNTASQTLLVTPKLIPNLKIRGNIQVCVVHKYKPLKK